MNDKGLSNEGVVMLPFRKSFTSYEQLFISLE